MCAATALAFESSLVEHAVQIGPGLLEEIRDRVLDGYAAAPHGGVELGFVLLGRSTESGTLVEHFREIPCAHLLSPRFLLSPDEEQHFPEWMNQFSADPELECAEVVGWCCSHHRSDLSLLDREIAFHQRYFSQPNQLLMVVKPQSMQAVVAGIFIPDRRGVFRAESPSVRLRSALLDSVLDRGLKTTNEQTEPKVAKPLPVAARVPLSPFLRAPRRSRASFLARRLRISGRWIGTAAILMALLVLAAAGGLHFSGAKASTPSLSVAIRPVADNVVFTWSGDIDRVESANLEILDGATTSHFDLTNSFQRTGIFVFPRHTGNVQVVLTARTKDQDLVRTIGFADSRQNANSRSVLDTAAPDSAAARLDATNRRLAALVSILQSRWKPREK
jgi:hypothetical protein